MITFFTAYYNEAKPLIDRFHLKKDMSNACFERFRFEKKSDAGSKSPLSGLPDISLIVTGEGALSMTAAVSYFSALYPPGENDFAVNIGCCAAVSDAKLGNPYLINSLYDSEYKRTYYPDMLYLSGSPLHEAALMSGNEVYPSTADDKETGRYFDKQAWRYSASEAKNNGQALSETPAASSFPTLYDMEGAAFFEAAKRFYTLDRIISIKIPTDRGLNSPADIKTAFETYYNIEEEVFDFILSLGKPERTRVFSHIYVEEDAFSYEKTAEIISYFPDVPVINMRNYKEIFSPNRRDPKFLSSFPSLIIAKKRDSFLYNASQNCQYEGQTDSGRNFYVLTAMNCLYDCSYCFLKGMYPCPYPVLFVNTKDCFLEIEEVLKDGPAAFSLSYETDLAAIDGFFHTVSDWISFAAAHPEGTFEIRTKSAGDAFLSFNDTPSEDLATFNCTPPGNFLAFNDMPPEKSSAFTGTPPKNFIAAFTLSPQEVIDRYEKGAPSLSVRLAGVKKCINAGFQTRLCFDPMINIEDWQQVYSSFFNKIFCEIDFEKLRDVTVGTFRMPGDYLKNMKKHYKNTALTALPDSAVSKEMTDFAAAKLSRAISPEKILVI